MVRQKKQIFAAIGLLMAVFAAAFLYLHFTEPTEEPADGLNQVVIDLTTIPLVLNDVIFNLERKILETELNELRYGSLSDDKARADEYFQDLSQLYDTYKNTYQPEKARRIYIRMQSLTGDESRPPEYEGPVVWEFEKPVAVEHEGFALTIDDTYGAASSIFSGTRVGYTLDPAANFFSLLRIKINDSVEIQNISFDVSNTAENVVFKFLGDNGEVPVMYQGNRISVDVSGFTSTLEIAVVYPIPQSVTISGLIIKMREVTADTPPGPKRIG